MTVEKSQVFGWINRIVAVGYLATAVLVGWRAAAYDRGGRALTGGQA